MYGGSAVILVVYFVATYVYMIPSSVSALCFMSLPSLVLFFCISKYKDSRFFLTLTMLDTIMLAFGCVMRWVITLTGLIGDLVVLAASIAILTTFFIIWKPSFKRYHEVMAVETNNWFAMAVTSCLIYVVMIFTAAYPKPLAERPEYGVPYLILCIMVLACYYVFVQSIMKTRVICQQNQQLLQEKKFHRIAYTDALTGLKNRAAYMERVEELERSMTAEQSIGVLFFDMNRFKQVNDTYGHDMGDKVLQYFGKILSTVFQEEKYDIYRIGGDEFIAFTTCTEKDSLEQLISQVKQQLERQKEFEFPVTVAIGMAVLGKNAGESLEDVLRRADKEMYRNKLEKSELLFPDV